jgi:hypothetical protein
MRELQEMLIILKETGVKYGLYINEEKTKYIKMTAIPSDKLPKVTIEQYTFDVRNFTYLGVLLNNRTVSEDINKRIMTGNKPTMLIVSFLKVHSFQDQLN